MPPRFLDDRYSPITSELGFLECSAMLATEAYLDWMRPIQAKRGIALECREVDGNFISKIRSLLPLTSIERRRVLLLPTQSRWTAYLDNGWQGTDAFSAVSFLSQKIGCYGIRAVSVPHTLRKSDECQYGRYGATIFELYSPTVDGCSFLNTRRSVSAANDGGRWKFFAAGEALEFEDQKKYAESLIQNRFTSEMLCQYLKNYGIQFFSAEFYEASQPAFLVAKQGPCATGLKEYSLEEVQSKY